MKIVWILASWISEWYNEDDTIMRSYRYEAFKRRWIELIVLDMIFYDFEKFLFTAYKSQKFPYKIIEKNIMPELIRVRTSLDREWYLANLQISTKLFPSQLVISLANDKRNAYRAFKKYQPKTSLASNATVMSWKKFVLKPRRWYWWEWVNLISKSELKNLDIDLDSYIIQELCDFTWWAPWICEWNHDVRLVYIWWILTYWSVRQTNKDDFRVNVSLWWYVSSLDIWMLPKDLLQISWKILAHLWWENTWVVSFDFWFDSIDSIWKLIEINDSPWFASWAFDMNKQNMDIAYNAYADVFNQLI